MKYQIKLSTIILIGLLSLTGIFLISGCESGEKGTETAEAEAVQLWTCGMHPEVIVDEPGQCPKCGMNLVPVKSTQVPKTQTAAREEKKDRKILYWQAPMNPTEIHDRPGKSAMGMDLIPVYEDEAGLGSGGLVSIDPVTMQNMGVRTAPVQRMDFTRVIRTVGKVDYNEETLYLVNTKISGWVEKLYVNFTGEFVKKGDPLLEIYSPELVTTQEEYLLALKNLELVAGSKFESIKEGAETLLQSTRKRLQYWDIPQSVIDRLEKTGEVQKTVILESPANGIVVHKKAVEGAHVKSGIDLYQIADLSSIWVHASIYDYEVPWIKEGQSAEMELSYLPGEKFKGRVSYIYPYLREKARDVHVRIVFSNPSFELKPGMYVNVQLQGKTLPNTIVVPSEAVIRSGERSVVFVVREAGKFEPREIRIGEEGGPENRYVRVISGLLDDDRVVTSAQFMLDSESRLQEAIQKMLQEKMMAKKQGAEHRHKDSETSGEGQLWTCDMHPEVIVDEPGQCPKCGMNLVQVKSSRHSEPQHDAQEMEQPQEHQHNME